MGEGSEKRLGECTANKEVRGSMLEKWETGQLSNATPVFVKCAQAADCKRVREILEALVCAKCMETTENKGDDLSRMAN